jgi:DNA-binding MarR family transcriptional regulator/GNAT superfamily N-acetyltransferase
MTVPAERIAAVREFNRMYTKIVGVLDEHMLRTPYSLTEVRVLFELSQQDRLAVTTLRRALDLDPGYLSRLLARFEADGLIERERSTEDGRQQVARLTAAGKDVFQKLDERSSEDVRALLEGLTDDGQRRLVDAMRVIKDQLSGTPRPHTVVLRPPRAGDLGWVVHRHGALYGQEYGWDSGFEALTAKVVADYLENYDPKREAAWIAELNGEPAGCVFCVRKNDHTARLRLLLVEPAARGAGVGRRLVEECVSFARSAGYQAIELWTVNVLHAARRIYQSAGFELTSEEPQRLFGHDLVGQTWRLTL